MTPRFTYVHTIKPLVSIRFVVFILPRELKIVERLKNGADVRKDDDVYTKLQSAPFSFRCFRPFRNFS